MKLEPVAWIGQDAFTAISGCEVICQTMTPKVVCEDDVALYAIPEGYVVVPLTDEIAAAMLAAKEA